MFVQKPTMSGGQWVVRITDSRSPLANVIETIPCGTSRESAWQAYRRIKKEQGKML